MIEKKQNFLGIFGLKCIHYDPYLKVLTSLRLKKILKMILSVITVQKHVQMFLAK